MITRVTRVLLLVQIAVVIGIAAALLQSNRVSSMPLAALIAIGVVALLRMLITANNFYIAWRFRSETPAAYRINALQACRLFFREFAASMAASSLSMPFSRVRQYLSRKEDAPPVLLLHGYICNSGYWHSMSRALAQAGISHSAIDLEPIMASIDDYAPAIHQAVQDLRRDSKAARVVIVAHSMGGLAARAYLRRYGCSDIAKIITLGTPHHGTAVAQFGLGLNSRQMHWSANEQEGLASPWLRELADSEDSSRRSLFVSVFTHHDNIVAPQTSSFLPGADNIAFGGIGHVALASHPAIQACVIEKIRKASHPRQDADAGPATEVPRAAH